MPEFSHFNDQGRARMVDVTEKAPAFRRAAAAGEVRVSKETLTAIREGKLKKGDVLAVALPGGNSRRGLLHRPHRGGDGGPHRRQRGGIDRLRYV